MTLKTRVEITGTEKFFKALKDMKDYSEKEYKKILSDAAVTTHKTAVKHIQNDNPSGQTYGRRSIRHKASAAGQYPTTDTGKLVRNITLEPEGGGYTVGSRAGAPHGFYLEFKPPSQGGRPWLSRAFDEMVGFIKGKYGIRDG